VFAIQAKHTKNRVPVETLRALAGTLHDVNASHGILVTTSWYGKASVDFAHRHGRLHLIDSRGMKSLLREHLDIDALVSLPKTPPGWKPRTCS
jgi:restriction system protein